MRGFFSMDALFALTLLMLVCSSFLHVYQGRMEAARGISWGLEARMVGEELAGTINAVYSGGPGLELRLKVPERPSLTLAFESSRGEVVVKGEHGEVRVGTVCNNVENFLFSPENLGRILRVYWEENRIRVVSG
jgi:hypothetical protein